MTYEPLAYCINPKCGVRLTQEHRKRCTACEAWRAKKFFAAFRASMVGLDHRETRVLVVKRRAPMGP